MNPFRPELEAGAKACFEHVTKMPWRHVSQKGKEAYLEAYAAGLRAIPVSDELTLAIDDEIKRRKHLGCSRTLSSEFKAAVRFLTGDAT